MLWPLLTLSTTIAMKLEEREIDALIRKVNSFVKHADVEDRRIILWTLLKGTVINDWKGVRWLYEEFMNFVEKEFGQNEFM